MSSITETNQPLQIGSAKIDLQKVALRDDVLLDEFHLEGGDIRIDAASGGAEAQISTGDTKVRAVMSEANLNRMVNANLPADSNIRALHIALLSGRARISGKVMVGFVPIPFSIDATARVDSGVRVTLECQTATCGLDLPRAVVDVIQARLNDSLGLDFEELPIPIWIDSVRSDPGRLTASGRARITWPPVGAMAALSEERPLGAAPIPVLVADTVEEEEPQASLPAAPEATDDGVPSAL